MASCSEPPPADDRRKSKRKRQPFSSSNPDLEHEAAETSAEKKPRLAGVWAHLDLALFLHNKQNALPSKIDLASDFISRGFSNAAAGPIRISRLVAFLGGWVQSVLISAEHGNKTDSGILDPCLDLRCWEVLRFCFKNSWFSVSPNLLRPIARVARHASSLVISSDMGSITGLFNSVLEGLSLLLTFNARAFYNAGLELWVSCAIEVAGLASKLLTANEHGLPCIEQLSSFCSLLLEQFASFLRFHPNPRNVFRVFVDRLLDPLLELLVLLRLRTGARSESMVKNVEDVLLNGLFHPVHISGFLSLKSQGVKKEVRESKGINDSYQRHFFRKLEKIIAEKKAMALGGFGYLLRMFVSRTKDCQGPSAFKGDRGLGKGGEASEEAQQTSRPLFEVFVQFIEPLLRECRLCAQKEFSEPGQISEVELVEAHCMLRSVNETLASFIQERIYVRTEDTSEETHFNFLKGICDTIFSVSDKMYQLWLLALHKDDGSIKKMLSLIAREIFVAMGYFLEIEYRVVGEDLVKLWLMMLSYLAVNVSDMDTKPSSLLTSEIVKIGCQLMHVFSELRQVSNSVFTFCKAVRLLIHSEGDAVYYSTFLSSHLPSKRCLKSVATVLHSHEFRLAVSNAFESIPEGQASGCFQQMTIDIADTLNWMKSTCEMVHGENLGETKNSSSSMVDFAVKNELLGRYLSEIYTILLDSVIVTATNSISIRNSIMNLMKSMRSSFCNMVKRPSVNFTEFLFSVTGRKFCHSEVLDYGSCSHTSRDSMAWVFIFFFRLYISCRSLYRQLISFMPPDLSKTASKAMGSLFAASCGMDWGESPEFMYDDYFSWIITPSISLVDIIGFITKFFPSLGSASYASLVYVLNIMALQRLFDLNRLIKAYEFLLEKDLRAIEKQLLDCDGKKKLSRKWKRSIKAFRQEAQELTKFMTGGTTFLASAGLLISSYGNETSYSGETMSEYENAWDLSVCSLDQKSLPIAIWWILCRNADIWCAHVSKKNLRKFISHLLYSLTCEGSSRFVTMQKSMPLCNQKVTMHHISLEFLSDTVFYEQAVLYKHFASRFCHILKKSLCPIVSHARSSNRDFDSLSDWSDVSDIMGKRPISIMNDHSDLSNHSLSHPSDCDPSKLFSFGDSEKQSSSSNSISIKTCESLFNLLCRMPRLYVNARSFKVYATYILNVERLLVLNLLNYQCESSTYCPYELFRLFLSCRRTLRFLLVASSEENSGVIPPLIFSLVFDKSFSVWWLLKSTFEVINLPPSFFGERNSVKVKDMIFLLLDHTSYIFFTLCKGQIVASTSLIINVENAQGEAHKPNDPCEKGTLVEAGQHSNSSAWQYVEHMAEMLLEQTKYIMINLKGCLHATKLEASFSVLNWNALSSVISCLQGFLWGFISALDNMYEKGSKANSQTSRLILFYASKLSNCFTIFEDFLNLCMNLMLLDHSQETEIFNICNLSNLNSDDGCSGLDSHGPEKQYGWADLSASYDDNNVSKYPSENDCLEPSSIKRQRQKSSSVYTHYAINDLNKLHRIGSSEFQNLNGSLIQSLLKGESPQIAFTLRQLFIASAAILKLKLMALYPRINEAESGSEQNSLAILLETSHIVLHELAATVGKPDPFYFIWSEGIFKYYEVVGSFLNLADPESCKDLYSQLLDSHMRAIGKCISLQGKAAKLSSHELNSDSKLLESQNVSIKSNMPSLDPGKPKIDLFKSRVRVSFGSLVKSPLKLHVLTAVQAIERALVGVHQNCNVVYNINTGNLNGGKVSALVASGIDCLDLLLDIVSGRKRVIKRNFKTLVGAVFNIVLHLQNPAIFYQEKSSFCESKLYPDSGAVVLMCVGVLTKVAGGHSYELDESYVSQCLHIPVALFRDFLQLRASQKACNSLISDNGEARSFTDVHQFLVDRQFCVDLYAACCKLLYTTLRHRKSEAGQCVALLENSVSILLGCLETVDARLVGEDYFAWEMQEAVKCASFFRRIYEEIRQQKDMFGRYAYLFLSTYICSYSGTGIRREVDDALRPGVYSLIDICTPADLQHLHTVLREGPCRSTLANLQHDYRLNFQYEGKI